MYAAPGAGGFMQRDMRPKLAPLTKTSMKLTEIAEQSQ